MKYILPAALFLLTSSFGAPPSRTLANRAMDGHDYVSLYDFVRSFDVDHHFDIIFQRGKLYRKSSVAVYQVGHSVVLVNGRLVKSSSPFIRKEGEIFIPADLFRVLVGRFYPGASVRREGANYIIATGEESIRKMEPEEAARERDLPSREKGKDRIAFIIIDPGHGGRDPGAIGKGGVREKVITLKIAKYLETYLRGRLKGVLVKLTRGNDRFIELSQRTDMANRMLRENENGILVSIHVNASISPMISGFETYILSQNPSNEEARTTAALENNVIVLEDRAKRNVYEDVDYVEALMLTTEIQKESALLADSVQRKMDDAISEFKSKGVKRADFYVLRGAMMPAVLTEVGFISHKKEAKFLMKGDYQEKIACGIGEGIIRFIKKYNALIKNK